MNAEPQQPHPVLKGLTMNQTETIGTRYARELISGIGKGIAFSGMMLLHDLSEDPDAVERARKFFAWSIDRACAESAPPQTPALLALPHDKTGQTVLPGNKFKASCGHAVTVRPYEAFGFCDAPGCFDMHFQLPARRYAADGSIILEESIGASRATTQETGEENAD